MKTQEGFHAIPRVLALLVALFICSGASGELITVTFDGTLSNVEASLAGRFSLGDPMHVSITYESTTPDGWPDPDNGYYPAITSFNVLVEDPAGDYTASASDGHFVVNNDRSGGGGPDDAIFAEVNAFGGGTLVGDPVDGMPLWQFLLQLDDGTGTALSNDLLPTSFDPTLFDNNQLILYWRHDTGHGIYDDGIAADTFTSTSSFTPVPLPGALLLGILGLGTAGGLVRRHLR